MSKFKVGDRVVMYEGPDKYIGTVITFFNTEVGHNYQIQTDLDEIYPAHEKQLRRLKKKEKPKPTEWWLHEAWRKL